MATEDDVRDTLAKVLYERLFFGKWVTDTTDCVNLSRLLADDLMKSDKMRVQETEPSKLALVHEGVHHKKRAIVLGNRLNAVRAIVDRADLAGTNPSVEQLLLVLEEEVEEV